MQIIQDLLNDNQYFHSDIAKKRIVYHHLAGVGSPRDWWNGNSEMVGTLFSFMRNGEVRQHFKKMTEFAYQLGIGNKEVEASSIGFELASYGFLRYKNGKYFNDYGGVVSPKEVIELPEAFRGFKFFHAYTDEMIASVIEMTEIVCEQTGIRGHLSIKDFELLPNPQKPGGGFYTHCSFRSDKIDIYPDHRLIEGLKKGWHPKYSS